METEIFLKHLDEKHRKALGEMENTVYGQALKAYLNDALSEIGDITATKDWEDTVGRKYAITMIRHLFSFMKEKKVSDRPRNQFT